MKRGDPDRTTREDVDVRRARLEQHGGPPTDVAPLVPAEGSVSSLVRDVSQREPVGVNPGQGAVTDPSAPDIRRLAAAMRAVDVIEKQPVESYVALATEIVAAYLALKERHGR